MWRKNVVPTAGTFSKHPSFWGKDFQPEYLVEGRGASVKGNNGVWYLDWVSGLGANLLGHCNIGWESYVNMYLRQGVSFSLPTQLEYEVAEQLVTLLGQHITHWQDTPLQVRWVKTGSDACDAAVRLARAVTGKTLILNLGYHGWDDAFIAGSPPALGIVPELANHIGQIEFNNLASLEKYAGNTNIAAVIVEQGLVEPSSNWYSSLRKFCDEHQALLIVDEVVTGIRYARGGACEIYNIKPDLVCLGKALANGLALGALIGPEEYLSWFSRVSPVFVSSTNVGETVALAGSKWLLNYIADGKYLSHLQQVGNALLTGLADAGCNILGNYARSLIMFSNNVERGFFIANMRDQGVLINRPNFVTMSHTLSDVKKTVTAAENALRDLASTSTDDWTEWESREPFVLFRNR